MMPAHPPPPTNWNLPFQFSGSHASISISESGDGRRIALTRQCAGTICGGAAGPPRPPWAPWKPRPAGAPAGVGGVNGPVATIPAATIVTFGSESDFRLSHVAGDEASVAPSARATIMTASNVASAFGWTDSRPAEAGRHGIPISFEAQERELVAGRLGQP